MAASPRFGSLTPIGGFILDTIVKLHHEIAELHLNRIAMPLNMEKRVRIRLRGIVQGVGFRPFVHHLAANRSLPATCSILRREW